MGKFFAVMAVMVALVLGTVSYFESREAVKYNDLYEVSEFMAKHAELKAIESEFTAFKTEVGYIQDTPKANPDKPKQDQKQEKTDIEKIREGLNTLGDGIQDTVKWAKKKLTKRDPASMQEAMMELQEKIEAYKNMLQEFKKQFRDKKNDPSSEF